jgi:hypothetical protein
MMLTVYKTDMPVTILTWILVPKVKISILLAWTIAYVRISGVVYMESTLASWSIKGSLTYRFFPRETSYVRLGGGGGGGVCSCDVSL